MKNKLTQFLLLYLLIYSSSSMATGPRVAPNMFVDNTNQMHAVELTPFLDSNISNRGLLTELIETVLKLEKIKGDINILPSLNMVKYYFMQENALAIIGGDFNLGKKAKKKAIFIPILTVDEFYYYYQENAEQTLSWNGSLLSFKNKKMGVQKGLDVKKYKQAGINIKYGRLAALLKKMKSHKVDFIRGNKRTVETNIEQYLPKEKSLFKQVQPRAGTLVLGISFNKKHPEGINAANDFKTGLKEIMANGQFEAILQKHLGSDVKLESYIKYLN